MPWRERWIHVLSGWQTRRGKGDPLTSTDRQTVGSGGEESLASATGATAVGGLAGAEAAGGGAGG